MGVFGNRRCAHLSEKYLKRMLEIWVRAQLRKKKW